MRPLIPVCAIVFAITGCGDKGENRFRLSGEALCEGQPIPYGDVLFTPDSAKGNTGAQGYANIRDGKYDTKSEEGKGFAGGATVVRVTGLSGPNGKVICEYEYQVDLPAANGTFKVDVPAKGAVKGEKKPEI